MQAFDNLFLSLSIVFGVSILASTLTVVVKARHASKILRQHKSISEKQLDEVFRELGMERPPRGDTRSADARATA